MSSAGVNNASLHDRLLPDRADRVGQALQPVADHHAHVPHTAVLDLGQHPQPVLRSLAVAVLPGPQPEMSRSPSTVTPRAR